MAIQKERADASRCAPVQTAYCYLEGDTPHCSQTEADCEYLSDLKSRYSGLQVSVCGPVP